MVRVLASPAPGLPDVGMSQSSVLISALAAGFVVYLMMNQKLAVYWSILLGGSTTGSQSGGASAGSSSSSTTGSTATSSTTTTASSTSGNATPLTTPAPGTGSGGIGSA